MVRLSRGVIEGFVWYESLGGGRHDVVGWCAAVRLVVQGGAVIGCCVASEGVSGTTSVQDGVLRDYRGGLGSYDVRQ